MIAEGPPRQGSRATLIFFFVILLFVSATVFLLSLSQTGNSGLVRDTAEEVPRPFVRDRPQKGTANGAILIGIVGARLQGNPHDPASLYCAIGASALNADRQEVRNLVLGFDYVAPNGDKTTGNVTFAGLYPDSVVIKQHYVAKVSNCQDLKAKLTVVACTVHHGLDCTARVQAIRQGFVQLE